MNTSWFFPFVFFVGIVAAGAYMSNKTADRCNALGGVKIKGGACIKRECVIREDEQ